MNTTHVDTLPAGTTPTGTTRPETAARVIAENIRRGEAGLPFLHLVDRTSGY